MVGWFTFGAGRGTALEQVPLLGLPLLRVRVPPPRRSAGKALARRVEKGALLLARAGCRRVLAAPGFPHWAALEAHGLRPVDPEPLVQALAAPLVLAALARRGLAPERAAVALRGSRVNRALFEAAQLLCPRVRALTISAPGGGADLRAYLREEYGAAALEEGAVPPDAALWFAPPTAGAAPPPAGADLRLYGPVPVLDGLALRSAAEPLPEELDALPALTLLWEEGRISKEGLEIFSTEPGGN